MTHLWIVDIEASGLSPNSYPIEVGLYNGQNAYHSLIIPEESWCHWSLKAEAMHGISRKTLFEQGKPIAVVAKELNRLLGTNVVYSDHEDWDNFWLKRLFSAVNITPNFRVADINELLNNETMSIYVTTLDKLSKRKDHQAHRALNDAHIIHGAISRALA